MINYIKQNIKRLYLRLKYSNVSIGSNTSISLNTKLSKGVKLIDGCFLGACNIGTFTYIGSNSHFTFTDVGSYCSVGQEVICGMGTHPINFVSTYPGFYSQINAGSVWFGVSHDFQEQKQSTIESDVWIGARAIIMGGIKIGVGAIIGAGAVVTKDVPPYAIVGGVPATIIRYRFDDEVIKRLLVSKWWEKDETTLRNLAIYMNDPQQFLNLLEKKEVK